MYCVMNLVDHSTKFVLGKTHQREKTGVSELSSNIRLLVSNINGLLATARRVPQLLSTSLTPHFQSIYIPAAVVERLALREGDQLPPTQQKPIQ